MLIGSLAELIQCAVDVSGELISKPQSTEVHVGNNARLSCQSDNEYPVNWEVIFSSFREQVQICYSGKILEDYVEKYALHTDAEVTPRAYNLIIRNAESNDAGEYTCTERKGLGESASASLTVIALGKDYVTVRCLYLVVAEFLLPIQWQVIAKGWVLLGILVMVRCKHCS